MTTEERRKSTRVGLVSGVQVQPVVPEGSSSIAWGADLSEGGIELLAVNPLKVGEEVSLQISVPGSDMPISVKGRVVWAQPTQVGHRIGMQFQDVEALAQARILQLVTERLARLTTARQPAVATPQAEQTEVQPARSAPAPSAPSVKAPRLRRPFVTILLAIIALVLFLQNGQLRRSVHVLEAQIAALQAKAG